MSKRIVMSLLVATAVGAILCGCASPTAETGAHDKVAKVVANPGGFLRAGMTVDQMRSVLGEPDEKRPMAGTDGRGETWVYRARIPRGNDILSAQSAPRPYFDPFTGEIRDVQEPVYTQQTVTQVVRLNLLVYGGKLQRWVTTEETEKKLL